MNIKDFKASLPYLTKAELTPFIWGHAGVGKSSVVKQFAEENGYLFFPFYLGTQSDIGDILGLADFARDKNGTVTATKFAPPEWLVNMIAYCEKNPQSGAILFLDEFNRARRDILNGMFSLALDKTFHTLKLPKNCYVIAAGNPPTDDYVTTDVDETALMARFVHVKLEPSFDEWVEYAKATNVEPTLVAFFRQQPELLGEKRSAFELPVKPDNRAVSRLDRLFKVETPSHLLNQLMPGIIGLERTVAYQNFLANQDKPLTGEEVIKGKKFEFIEKWSNPEEINGSLLNLTGENLIASFKSMDEKQIKLKDKEKKNVMKFFEIVPKDISYRVVNTMVDMDSPVFHDFYTAEDYQATLLKIVREAKDIK